MAGRVLGSGDGRVTRSSKAGRVLGGLMAGKVLGGGAGRVTRSLMAGRLLDGGDGRVTRSSKAGRVFGGSMAGKVFGGSMAGKDLGGGAGRVTRSSMAGRVLAGSMEGKALAGGACRVTRSSTGQVTRSSMAGKVLGGGAGRVTRSSKAGRVLGGGADRVTRSSKAGRVLGGSLAGRVLGGGAGRVTRSSMAGRVLAGSMEGKALAGGACRATRSSTGQVTRSSMAGKVLGGGAGRVTRSSKAGRVLGGGAGRVTRSSKAGRVLGGSLAGEVLGGSKESKPSEKKRRFDTESKGLVCDMGKRGRKTKRFKLTEHEMFRPVAAEMENCGVSNSESIGTQGGNGVFKVMSKKNKKKGGESEKNGGLQEVKETRKLTSSADNPNLKAPLEKKNQVNSRKVRSIAWTGKKKDEVQEQKKYTVDISSILSSKDDLAVQAEDGTVKPKATGQQLIRVKIQEMLLNAGWTFERRERMSKPGYFDAVYVNTENVTHWSIIKAYVAHKKACEAAKDDSFIPVPDEELSILTRVTRKKVEREMEMPADGGEGSTEDTLERKLLKLIMKGRAIQMPAKPKEALLTEAGDAAKI